MKLPWVFVQKASVSQVQHSIISVQFRGRINQYYNYGETKRLLALDQAPQFIQPIIFNTIPLAVTSATVTECKAEKFILSAVCWQFGVARSLEKLVDQCSDLDKLILLLQYVLYTEDPSSKVLHATVITWNLLVLEPLVHMALHS